MAIVTLPAPDAMSSVPEASLTVTAPMDTPVVPRTLTMPSEAETFASTDTVVAALSSRLDVMPTPIASTTEIAPSDCSTTFAPPAACSEARLASPTAMVAPVASNDSTPTAPTVPTVTSPRDSMKRPPDVASAASVPPAISSLFEEVPTPVSACSCTPPAAMLATVCVPVLCAFTMPRPASTLTRPVADATSPSVTLPAAAAIHTLPPAPTNEVGLKVTAEAACRSTVWPAPLADTVTGAELPNISEPAEASSMLPEAELTPALTARLAAFETWFVCTTMLPPLVAVLPIAPATVIAPSVVTMRVMPVVPPSVTAFALPTPSVSASAAVCVT